MSRNQCDQTWHDRWTSSGLFDTIRGPGPVSGGHSLGNVLHRLDPSLNACVEPAYADLLW